VRQWIRSRHRDLVVAPGFSYIITSKEFKTELLNRSDLVTNKRISLSYEETNRFRGDNVTCDNIMNYLVQQVSLAVPLYLTLTTRAREMQIRISFSPPPAPWAAPRSLWTGGATSEQGETWGENFNLHLW
jgi:hypothetical protein